MEIKTYIDELFAYIDTYESQYSSFETQAFLQTYNGTIAVFQALRQQRQEAVEVDQYFLDKIKQAPLTSSDLRQLTVQIIITFFESEADTDGQSNRAYQYCRGLRPVKQDIPYFERTLIPLLFDPGGLNDNFRLREFLLAEIARYMNKFGRPLDSNLSPEAFQGLSDPMKILELNRRMMQMGTDLVRDRSTLEFHLQRIDAFNKLAAHGKIYDEFLRKWDYIRSESFWSRVKGSFAGAGGKLAGTFSSFGYFRLVMTQRKAAYFYYTILILVFLLVAIYVPLWWQDYSAERLQNFQQHVENVSTRSGGSQ